MQHNNKFRRQICCIIAKLYSTHPIDLFHQYYNYFSSNNISQAIFVNNKFNLLNNLSLKYIKHYKSLAAILMYTPFHCGWNLEWIKASFHVKMTSSLKLIILNNFKPFYNINSSAENKFYLK